MRDQSIVRIDNLGDRYAESVGGAGCTSQRSHLRRHKPVEPHASAADSFVRRSFAHFWYWYRERTELAGASLAALHSLMGAEEQRFRGYLVIRDDLDPAEYLAIPNVRTAWRFLASVGESDKPERRAFLRRIGVDFSAIDFTSYTTFQHLCAIGFIDQSRPNLLSEHAIKLVKTGSVGPFYRAFLLDSIGRCTWGRHDGLADGLLVQNLALFLLFLVHQSGAGCSAMDLARHLDGIARFLTVPRGAIFLPRDLYAVAAIVQQRLLSGFGSRFGLLQADSSSRRFRESSFASRVLCWQSRG